MWAVEPNVGRVATRVPARMDRLKGLGNAVVPEIPYQIAMRIREAM
jgi:DNA (cytosine-5)-methyltransferase 1